MAEVAGRVLTLFTHPLLEHKLWAGTAHGGLWQSLDSGLSWRLASAAMSKLPVSTLAVSPTNAEIMFAGTGEGHSNAAKLRGHGIYKSNDGGVSWSLLPLTNPAAVGESWSRVNHIAISATGVILAATSDNKYNGFIYRSEDGGASWGLFPVYTASTIGPNNVIYKIKFDPKNPAKAIFIDAYANVTYSSDGGTSWKVDKKSSMCK